MRDYLIDAGPLAGYLLGREWAVEAVGTLLNNHEAATSILVYGEVSAISRSRSARNSAFLEQAAEILAVPRGRALADRAVNESIPLGQRYRFNHRRRVIPDCNVDLSPHDKSSFRCSLHRTSGVRERSQCPLRRAGRVAYAPTTGAGWCRGIAYTVLETRRQPDGCARQQPRSPSAQRPARRWCGVSNACRRCGQQGPR